MVVVESRAAGVFFYPLACPAARAVTCLRGIKKHYLASGMKKRDNYGPVCGAKTGDKQCYSPLCTIAYNLAHMGIKYLELLSET